MNVSFTENGWKDYLDWQKNDKRIVKRIEDIFQEEIDNFIYL